MLSSTHIVHTCRSLRLYNVPPSQFETLARMLTLKMNQIAVTAERTFAFHPRTNKTDRHTIKNSITIESDFSYLFNFAMNFSACMY